MASKQGETGTITKTTSDPDKKEFADLKIDGTKQKPLTCMDIIERMRKEGKDI
jgi:hypothetical protein